jgi:hypothetical protein
VGQDANIGLGPCGNLGAGDHGEHARHDHRRSRIDVHDLRMRMRRAQEGRVGHHAKDDIVKISSAPFGMTACIRPNDGLPDEASRTVEVREFARFHAAPSCEGWTALAACSIASTIAW